MADSTALHRVIDALVAQAPTAVPTGVIVIDGESGTTESDADFLIVGSSNADGSGDVRTGDARQSWRTLPPAPGGRTDEGTVNLLAGARNGDFNQKACRDAAVAILDAVSGLIIATPSLGVPSILWCRPGDSIAFEQFSTDAGALWCLITFQITYKAHV